MSTFVQADQIWSKMIFLKIHWKSRKIKHRIDEENLQMFLLYTLV